MLRYILIFLIGCTTDVSISKTYKSSDDTSIARDDTTTSTETANDPKDTGESTLSQDLSNTVAYVEMGLMQASCPYCMGLQQEINITAKARFHQPTTGEHTSWLPSQSGCRDYYASSVTSPNINANGIVTLINDFGDSVQLQQSADQTGVIYESNFFLESNFRRNSYHTLKVNNKTAQDVIQTLRGFDYVEPYTMLYVDPSYAFQAPINRYGNNLFTWGPSGDNNSFFTIHISVYSYDGSQYYGTVICRSEDVGSMSIPGSYFQQYQQGSLVSIHLMRHRIFKKEYEDFYGTIEGYSWWEVIGTGYIQ